MLSPQKGNLGVSFNNTKISGSGGVIANLPSMFLQSEVANLYSKLAVLECRAQSPKFKRVSLNETPEFPFWGLNICVDFD